VHRSGNKGRGRGRARPDRVTRGEDRLDRCCSSGHAVREEIRMETAPIVAEASATVLVLAADKDVR
jgi:hypothetical protein